MFRVMGWVLAGLCVFTVGVIMGMASAGKRDAGKDLRALALLACIAAWIWAALAKGVR